MAFITNYTFVYSILNLNKHFILPHTFYYINSTDNDTENTNTVFCKRNINNIITLNK